MISGSLTPLSAVPASLRAVRALHRSTSASLRSLLANELRPYRYRDANAFACLLTRSCSNSLHESASTYQRRSLSSSPASFDLEIGLDRYPIEQGAYSVISFLSPSMKSVPFLGLYSTGRFCADRRSNRIGLLEAKRGINQLRSGHRCRLIISFRLTRRHLNT